jgi:hypothetical protein
MAAEVGEASDHLMLWSTHLMVSVVTSPTSFSHVPTVAREAIASAPFGDGSLVHEGSQTDGAVRMFWMFLVGHIVVWTLVPVLTQPNLPLDIIEMLYWGREWQWGYFKHPPLPAWICETLRSVFGNAHWPLYLASQACVAGCLWGAWRMARQTLSPWEALSAAALLEGCWYYNYTTPEFNNNVTAKLGWALATVLIYGALRTGRTWQWCASGVAMAVALLSKYDGVLLIASLLAFSMVHSRARRCWATTGPFVAIAVAASILAPHVLWVLDNNLITVSYLRDRSAGNPTALSKYLSPFAFLFSQLGAVGMAALLIAPLAGWKVRWRRCDPQQKFQRDFLLAATLGPLALALLFALITGAQLRSMWGASMFGYVGVLLFLTLHVELQPADARHLVSRCAILSIVLAAVYGVMNVVGPHLRHKPSRVHFPGLQLASHVHDVWRKHHGAPLPIIAGDAWLAGNAAFYGPSCPSVYPSLRADWAPWTSDEKLRREGGVIVWHIAADGDSADKSWKNRFPEARLQPPVEFSYQTSAGMQQLCVGVAVIPPRSTRLAAGDDAALKIR